MKTATIPSLRVAPALREAAESVLREDETLSGFVEASLRAQIDLRRTHEDFIARGLAAREQARTSGRYVSSTTALKRLEARLAKAKKAR
jgi:hypothetical protein